MKKFLIAVCIFFILPGLLFSQITIDVSDFASPGMTLYAANDTSPLSPSITPGNAGANQIWDFSALANDKPETLFFKSPASSGGYTYFPGSTLAVENSGDPNLFLKVNTSGILMDGIYGDLSNSGDSFPLNFNPDKKVTVLPATYLTMFYDTNGYDAKFPVTGFPGLDSVRIKRIEYVQAQYDAYGTVILPQGSYSALRQYDQITDIDSTWIRIFGTWSFNSGSITSIEDYNWVAKGMGNSLVDFEMDTGGVITNVNYLLTPAFFPLDSVIVTKSDITCNSACDGTISVVPEGGNPPYNYTWSTGDSVPAIDSVCAGTYFVTITDSIGNFVVDSVSLTEPAVISTFLVTTDATCNTVNDGNIDFTVSGGIIPYTYLWSNGAVTQDVNSLLSGNYYVTLTDNNGCNKTDSAVINETFIIGVSRIVTDVSCYGGNDGAINITPSGGNSPYTFSWSNGQTTEDAGSLTAGDYTVTITDAFGCDKLDTRTVNEPGELTLSTSANNAACNTNDGDAAVSANGGTNPYSYLWDSLAGNQTTNNATGLYAGIYSVTVTDNNGCMTSSSVVINNTGGPSVAVDTIINVSCFGGNDGQAAVTAAGGAPPYDYQWCDCANSQTTSTATGLEYGVYSITVSDTAGCLSALSLTLTQPTALATAFTTTDESCFSSCDGNIIANAGGGTPPYDYLWSTNDSLASVTALCPGTYRVTVTDLNGCSKTDSSIVNMGITVTSGFSYSGNQCLSGNSIYFINTGTSGASVTYSWTFSGGTPSTAAIENPSGISWSLAGSYTVKQVVAKSVCSDTSEVIIDIYPNSSVTLTKKDATCFGSCDGSATAAASGVAPFTFTWQSGGNQNTEDSLCAGAAYVITTDSNGCVSNDSIVISEPGAMSMLTVISDVNCYGKCDGNASVFAVFGGTWPYSYQWSNGDITSLADSLCTGSYNVTVSDSAGCTATSAFSITEPAMLFFTSTTTPSTCGNPNGIGCISVSGGVSPYSYLWNDPMNQTISCAFNLYAGTYMPLVQDANGCTYSAPVLINDIAGAVIASISSTDESAQGAKDGTATVYTTGGSPPFTYLWSDSAGQTTQTASGLSSGWYYVTVDDANGCTDADSVFVDVITGVAIAMKNNVELYPNPVSDKMFIVNRDGKTLNFSLKDTEGRTVIPCSPVGSQTVVDTKLLPNGVYCIELYDAPANIKLYRKIIILR